MGVAALRQAHGETSTDNSVDVILRVPRKPEASIRTMDASVEVSTITTWLANSDNLVSEALVATNGESLDTRIGLEAISHRWEASCEGHCPLSVVCHEEAVKRDDPMLLGDATLSALGSAKTIPHATALDPRPIPRLLTKNKLRPISILGGKQVNWPKSLSPYLKGGDLARPGWCRMSCLPNN